MNDESKLINMEKIHGRESDYQNVAIMIKGLYEFGIGYGGYERLNAFQNDVYKALMDKGYSIEKSDEPYMCDRLHKADSQLDLYMHPMKLQKYLIPVTV